MTLWKFCRAKISVTRARTAITATYIQRMVCPQWSRVRPTLNAASEALNLLRETDEGQFFCTMHWPPASFRLLQSAVAWSEVANDPTWTRYQVPL